MGASGSTTINFGAFPGGSDASVTVSAPTIAGSSLVEAWIFPAATADHTVDEHLVESIRIIAGNVVASTGFTIYAVNTSQLNEPMTEPNPGTFHSAATSVYGYVKPSVGGVGTRIYGTWSVGWVWN
jgi:hypothetical protein